MGEGQERIKIVEIRKNPQSEVLRIFKFTNQLKLNTIN